MIKERPEDLFHHPVTDKMIVLLTGNSLK